MTAIEGHERKTVLQDFQQLGLDRATTQSAAAAGPPLNGPVYA